LRIEAEFIIAEMGAQLKNFNAQAQIAQEKNKIGKAQAQIAQLFFKNLIKCK